MNQEQKPIPSATHPDHLPLEEQESMLHDFLRTQPDATMPIDETNDQKKPDPLDGSSVQFMASTSSQTQNVNPNRTNGETQTGTGGTFPSMSRTSASTVASMRENRKKTLFTLLLIFALLPTLFFVLYSNNIISLSEFKRITYINRDKTEYSMEFYSRHRTSTLASTKNLQLISNVSREGKFPLTLSIATNKDSTGRDRLLSCIGYRKALTVYNDMLEQDLTVCDMVKQTSMNSGVYFTVIDFKKRLHVVTISQDLSELSRLRSSRQAELALEKFGLEVYHRDIEKILQSIKIL